MNFNNKQYEKIDYALEALPMGEYENCTFNDCNFANSDISDTIFIDCKFEYCNLSLVKVKNTAFKGVKFKHCKLLGITFGDSSGFLLALDFEGCLLNLASFYKLRLRGTTFKKCTMHETDFSGADLTGATFDNCDLLRAVFASAILEKADFTTSYNYSIDPEGNRVKKARFSYPGVLGLLDRFNIEIE